MIMSATSLRLSPPYTSFYTPCDFLFFSPQFASLVFSRSPLILSPFPTGTAVGRELLLDRGYPSAPLENYYVRCYASTWRSFASLRFLALALRALKALVNAAPLIAFPGLALILLGPQGILSI